MFYFKFKDKECSLKIKLIQDLFGSNIEYNLVFLPKI